MLVNPVPSSVLRGARVVVLVLGLIARPPAPQTDVPVGEERLAAYEARRPEEIVDLQPLRVPSTTPAAALGRRPSSTCSPPSTAGIS